jgi:GT2 family glycosyltransferase
MLHDTASPHQIERAGPAPRAAGTPVPGPGPRLQARGKFLFAGAAKYWVKGVTYGTFAPGADGLPFPDPATVQRDFAAMAAHGINTVRTYTAPPPWLLDAAQGQGLRVLAGLAWEQHLNFLDLRSGRHAIEARVRQAARSCAGHPALFGFTVGNEIPAQGVRWYGRRRIERFIRRLYGAAKDADPAALVTYVNYPTTEYLELPFLDLVCFNVYLESQPRLEAYLARLQNLAGERPLLMAEIGLDSRRNGLQAQADSLAWQVPTAFAAGCAGSIVFAWTDQWHRGGHDIDDWDFGLTTRDRAPKPALSALRRAYAQLPFPTGRAWPAVSVVVCSYNGARTLRDTLDALGRLEYPDFEVIVVNDGSTDATPSIAASYGGVRLISTANHGLSAARNTGWQAAAGEIVAYIDDDAYPDPHWLHYLAHAFMTTGHVGIGGPNIAPPGDGPVADCVANAPGGPVHVLLTDTLAEHIPGCNMAFRRAALAEIGGFDARYRTAGDDVDVCWRLQERGGTLGFHAGAMDWHHRRNSVRMYWRQQKGYGRAEALLEAKWTQRYNAAGHLAWAGRVYGRGPTPALPAQRARVYGGVWGTAAYQSLYRPALPGWLALPLMPEWYLLLAGLAALGLLGWSWPPLAWAWPVFAAAAAAPLAQAVLGAARARFPEPAASPLQRVQRSVLTAALHLMQPMARLAGRLAHGLTPWRRRGRQRGAPALRGTECVFWHGHWHPAEQRIARLEEALREDGAPVLRGGDFDPWDLQVRCGTLACARVLLMVEEHGAGRQCARWRLWPRPSAAATGAALGGIGLALAAAADRAWLAAAVLAIAAAVLAWRIATDGGAAIAAAAQALERSKE